MSNRLKPVSDSKKQWYAAAFIVLLVVVAIVGYSIKKAEAPPRVAFATNGGGVIFDHQMHANLKDTKCSECHHNYDDNDKSSQPAACRDCHYNNKELAEICEDAPIHKRCIGKQCASCHVSGTVDCTFCHNAEHFEKPKPPEEVTFETDGGTVVFNHTFHATADGAELDCSECHHGYDPGKPSNMSMNCRQCHYNTKYDKICEDQDTHVRCIGKNCVDCHTDGAEDCEICHK